MPRLPKSGYFSKSTWRALSRSSSTACSDSCACGDKVGILEFNTTLLRTGGIDAREYLNKLASVFPFAFARDQEDFFPLPWQTAFDDVAQGKQYITDLLLVSNATILEKMGLAEK